MEKTYAFGFSFFKKREPNVEQSLLKGCVIAISRIQPGLFINDARIVEAATDFAI